MVRIGLDLNLFDILSESNEPLNVAELAAKTGAAPTLTGESQSLYSRHSILVDIVWFKHVFSDTSIQLGQ
jgi:hypothetical protein